MLTLNSKSSTVENKLYPEMNTVSTSDKEKVTPSKITKTNIVGKRPGPKSKTCVPHLKLEKKTSNVLNKNEIISKQADSNGVIANSKSSKILNTSNADITDSIEVESKKIDINTAQLNESGIKDSIASHKDESTIKIDSSASTEENNKYGITSVKTDNVIVKIESNEIKPTTILDNFDTGEKCEFLEVCTNHLDEEKNQNIVIRVNKVTRELKEEEDNIQDQELDHEVDEEEINESSDSFNQTHNTVKYVQELNKDDNNEDSINLTIGEDDIKLFADEEDTNIEKEDEVIENHSKEETLSIKQRESCHPVTASSRSTTGLIKSRHSATEKRPSIGDKSRSTRKEDKDIINAKPLINVSVSKDEKNEVEKQFKDKVEASNKQSNDSKPQQISNDTSKKDNSSLVRNIWVSGLSSITKATDLKQLFSKYGKVVGAKVVTNAKTPGARCYGFVTLSTAEDANRSIENLHKTELHGRIISVERAKRDNGYQVTAKSSDSFKVNENSENNLKIKNNEEKKEKKDKREEKKEKRPEITINDVKKQPDLSTLKRVSKDQNQDPKRSKIVIESDEHRKDRSIKSKSNERDKERIRELEREREHLEREKRKQQEMLNLTKMKTERERLKQKEHERAMREEERKRRLEKERQLEIERKQKEEAIRLEKERQKLRIERERIEKEKAELLRLERENQRLERERLQREKEELRRAQEKLEETKRQALLKRAMPLSPPITSKRHSSSNSSRYEERKEPIRSSRIQSNTDYMNQAPPPPNITSSRHRYEQHSSDSRRMRPSPPPPPPPASRPKDSTVNIRYGVQPSTDHHYRNRDDRSDRRDESRRKDSSSGGSNRHAHLPYDSNKSSYGGLSRNSVSNSWSSAAIKNSYGAVGSSSGTNNMVINSRPDPWSHNTFRDMETSIWQRPSQPLPEKWNSTSSNPSSMPISGRSSSSNALYGNNHQVIPNMGLNVPTNYSDSRFDSYKMSSMSRKY